MHWIVRLSAIAAMVICAYAFVQLWKVGPEKGLADFRNLLFYACLPAVFAAALAVRQRAKEWASSPSKMRRLNVAKWLLVFAVVILLLIVVFGGLAT